MDLCGFLAVLLDQVAKTFIDNPAAQLLIIKGVLNRPAAISRVNLRRASQQRPYGRSIVKITAKGGIVHIRVSSGISSHEYLLFYV
jgi:hypothetical protein